LCQNAGNALQTACATQETAVILEKLNAYGAAAALLTGTGAVTYVIFTDAAAANAAAEELRNTFAPVFALAPEARGPHAVTCE
jgi:4-diphosphocytidyl-2C-methyl-D-erythritol kinase